MYCACGNQINYPNLTLSDSDCSKPCVGNPNIDLKCGASSTINIYETTTPMLNLYKMNSFFSKLGRLSAYLELQNKIPIYSRFNKLSINNNNNKSKFH